MQRFAELYWQLDGTTKSSAKLAALEAYFRSAPPADAAWAVYFLSGQRLRRLVVSRHLRQWAARTAAIPDWLFDECLARVGDVAETIALLLPPAEEPTEKSLSELAGQQLPALRGLEEAALDAQLRGLFQQLPDRQRMPTIKLMTGELRIGVSRQMLLRGLAAATGVEVERLASRLMGEWTPSADLYHEWTASESQAAPTSRPYPFCLAHPLSAESLETLGPVENWQCEWKWDGIRAQLLARSDQVFIWSRGEELINESFPEIEALGKLLPQGTVLDGELLAWDMQQQRPLPFAQLQRRIGRKRPGKKLLTEIPVVMLSFDLLEVAGKDWRTIPLHERREQLERIVSQVADPRLRTSPLIQPTDWDELAALRQSSREQAAEGLMLKRSDSDYRQGRVRGVWWKWKIEPMTIDAVLVYAQGGSGRRASLYTDYTFAVWKEGELVPIAKAYSGLSDEEIRQVDAFVRQNTVEKFGPVCRVTPQLVFELAFEGIQISKRHKAGFAVRFPRIARWRHDKQPAEADSVDRIAEMLSAS